MTPEAFIQQKAAAAIQAIYNTEVAPGSLQVAVTHIVKHLCNPFT